MGSNKGSLFERDVSRLLSRWWTGGERDDVFWRVGGSGGRAKFRGRSGRDTAGQHGDIMACDSSGEFLTHVWTIELKRGHSKDTVGDVLDRTPQKRLPVRFESWIQQVYESHEQAGSIGWMIVHKRDNRPALVFIDSHTAGRLIVAGAALKTPPYVRMVTEVPFARKVEGKTVTDDRLVSFYGTPLDNFLANVTPAQVMSVFHDGRGK